ncbi:hypothetical protein L227DRAFT_422193 [Lentinus tigrinus ALCF2SS1-6]|uniref:Uncharacterized protein n=1 Tax=Lentinus tigrinus ALCF2SS1-6 TaxID=1328759 RepID=A0A5C2RNJ0_9APHY|nr:hypothetical protein L227DRAFT_422193 [Lentinus tigrinus ALCF2SS1-6]
MARTRTSCGTKYISIYLHILHTSDAAGPTEDSCANPLLTRTPRPRTLSYALYPLERLVHNTPPQNPRTPYYPPRTPIPNIPPPEHPKVELASGASRSHSADSLPPRVQPSAPSTQRRYCEVQRDPRVPVLRVCRTLQHRRRVFQGSIRRLWQFFHRWKQRRPPDVVWHRCTLLASHDRGRPQILRGTPAVDGHAS